MGYIGWELISSFVVRSAGVLFLGVRMVATPAAESSRWEEKDHELEGRQAANRYKHRDHLPEVRSMEDKLRDEFPEPQSLEDRLRKEQQGQKETIQNLKDKWRSSTGN